jgi:hypothetical protein
MTNHNPHFDRAVEFLKSKFNGEVQQLYGADECAKLLAEYGNREFKNGVESTYTGGKRLEERFVNAWTGRIGIDKAEMARIAAKICLEIAEKSFKAGQNYEGFDSEYGEENPYPSFEDFKKEIL